MFVSKLFLVFALMLLVGQQLSADPVDYFGYDFETEFANPGGVSQVHPSAPEPSQVHSSATAEAPSSATDPLPQAPSTIDDAESDRTPARQPIKPYAPPSKSCLQKYWAYLKERMGPNAKRDHLNYFLGSGDDMFVGMGPLNRPLQHLQIIAIIAHLKADEKLVYFPPDTAQYDLLSDALIAGRKIKIFKFDQNIVPAGDALFFKMVMIRNFANAKVPPNLNYYAPGPNLDEITDPKLLSMAGRVVVEMFGEQMDSASRQFFCWKTAEEAAKHEINEFKQSKYNALDFVNAKDVEKWVLRGTGLESIEGCE